MAGRLVHVHLEKYQIVDGGGLVLKVPADWSNEEVERAVADTLDQMTDAADWGEQTSESTSFGIGDVGDFDEINLEEDTQVHDLIDEFTPDAPSADEEELTEHKCPNCGENRKSRLVWQSDVTLLCESCGNAFSIRHDSMTLWERIWERYSEKFEQKELKQQDLNEALEAYLGDGLDALAMQQIDDGGEADEFLKVLSEQWGDPMPDSASSEQPNEVQ